MELVKKSYPQNKNEDKPDKKENKKGDEDKGMKEKKKSESEDEDEEPKKLIKKVDKSAMSAKIAAAKGLPKPQQGASSSDETVAAPKTAPRKKMSAEDIFAARKADLEAAEVAEAKALGALAKANRAFALAELAMSHAMARKNAAANRSRDAAVSGEARAAASGEAIASSASGEDEDD